MLLDWLIHVWAPYAGCFDYGTYLLMDEFSVHMKSECVNAIQAQGTEVDFIAGGYTGVLQTLDTWDAALMWGIANQDTSTQQELMC